MIFYVFLLKYILIAFFSCYIQLVQIKFIPMYTKDIVLNTLRTVRIYMRCMYVVYILHNIVNISTSAEHLCGSGARCYFFDTRKKAFVL